MLCREVIAVHFKNRMKHTNMLCMCMWGVLVLRQVLHLVRLYFKELREVTKYTYIFAVSDV
jgi:hypothetical protein